MRFLKMFLPKAKKDSFETFMKELKADPRSVDWMEPYWVAFKEGSIKASLGKYKYHCPACGFPTLEERSAYEICMLCTWEDDGQDAKYADSVRGGPNSDYSLTEARTNFDLHGTSYRPSKDMRYLLDSTVKGLVSQLMQKYEGLRWRGRVPVNPDLEKQLMLMSQLREFLVVAILGGQTDPKVLAEWAERALEEFKRRATL